MSPSFSFCYPFLTTFLFLQSTQRLQTVLERCDKNEATMKQLEQDKEGLEAQLSSSQSKLADQEKLSAELIVRNESGRLEISKLTAAAHELRGSARKRELELVAEVERQKAEAESQKAEMEARKAEMEKLAKELQDLKASRQADRNDAFREGERQATVHYKKQVDEIARLMFEGGCQSMLKELEIPEDHPIHKNLPRYPSPEPDSEDELEAEALNVPPLARVARDAPMPAHSTATAPGQSAPTPASKSAPGA